MSRVLRNLWKEARFRQPPEPFDGRHEAALRPEPPASGASLLKGKAQRAYVCTKCLKAGKVQKAI